MSRKQGKLRIGTSGYQYDHWKGVFYPDDLKRDDWFGYYARHFDCVEINNTFYHLPDAGTFEKWRDQASTGFLYALKYSRFGTHMKKLKDPASHLRPFLDRADRLGPRLGPILVQLPPHWHADAGRLDAFLDRAGGDHRWAIEFRDPSWLTGEVFEVLDRHRAALCIHDKLPDHPRRVAHGWTYLRFHGPDGGGYPHQRLVAWVGWARDRLREGTDVYAFFNNDAEGHAIRDARRLTRYLD